MHRFAPFLLAFVSLVLLVATPVSASAKATPTPKAKAAAQHHHKKAKPKAKNSVTLAVWGNDGGSGTDITESTDTSNASVTAEINGGTQKAPAWSGTLPYNSKQMYYAVSAQMQGSGAIYCSVTIKAGGKTYYKQGSGSGDYEICTAQLNGEPSFTGGVNWQ